MKVDVITLHRVYNYGSVLQAYATQKVFEKAGNEVEIIDYITPQRTKKKIMFSIPKGVDLRGIKLYLYRAGKFFSIVLKELTFGSFVKKHLNLTSKYITAEDLEKNPPIADIYVTGSDQTWNSDYNQGIDRGFFLDFIPDDKKRISFASSFGKTELSDIEFDKTKEYLEKYSALSVRENSAIEVIKSIGRYDAVQLIDPTLQLTRDEWMQLASRRLVKKKYLILMLLYNEDNHATEYARKLADEKGLELVKISWDITCPPMVDKLFTHRRPEDFISLFAYADFVVTNSFHGLAFSINLQRQFIIVPRNEYNSRIVSLLSLLGLDDRLVFSENELMKVSKEKIEFETIEEKLNLERERAMSFIKELCC